EDGRRALGAERALLVTRSESFARIFDQRDSARVTELAEMIQLAGIAVDVDRDDRPRSVADRGLYRCGIEIERTTVDICEDGCRPFVDRTVCGGDERVRRGDDLVPGRDASRDAEQVQSRRAARDRGG